MNAAISYGAQIGATGDIQFIALPTEGGCDWGGMGSVPGTNSWYPSWGYMSDPSPVAHEAGHNLGMGHSGYNGAEYGDSSSRMSGSYRSGLCYAWPQQVYLGCEWGVGGGGVVCDRHQCA